MSPYLVLGGDQFYAHGMGLKNNHAHIDVILSKLAALSKPGTTKWDTPSSRLKMFTKTRRYTSVGIAD
jgi:hypothetical protein